MDESGKVSADYSEEFSWNKVTDNTLALEPGGELPRPLSAAAIGGLLAAILVALYLVPVLCTLISKRDRPVEVSGAAGSPAGGDAVARGVNDAVRTGRVAAGSRRR